MAFDPLTLIGGALGAVARLLPELGRLWEGASQRKHEREMLGLQMKADELRAQMAMQAAERQGEIAQQLAELTAMIEALKAQAKPLQKTGIKFIDFILGLVEASSAAVRPVLTYWYCVIGYGAYKIASYFMILSAGSSWENAITLLWTQQDHAVMWSIIGFWFVDRSLRRMNQ